MDRREIDIARKVVGTERQREVIGGGEAEAGMELPATKTRSGIYVSAGYIRQNR